MALAGVSLALAGLNLLGLPVCVVANGRRRRRFCPGAAHRRRTMDSLSGCVFCLCLFGQMALILDRASFGGWPGVGRVGGSANIAYYAALAASWWIGGLTLADRDPALPDADVGLGDGALFSCGRLARPTRADDSLPVDTAWYALGWVGCSRRFIWARQFCCSDGIPATTMNF
ncbi:MAG: hypothetical protein IPG51_04710 [Chloroflexi bacterium]|nr:hypothetical protein [Chloroflexota bacterium]